MENETPIFELEPDEAGEVDALDILQADPDMPTRFFNALKKIGDDTWLVSIKHGERTYTFRDSGPGAVTRLAAEFVGFSPQREAKREQARLEAQRQKELAERAAAERQSTLLRTVLDGRAV